MIVTRIIEVNRRENSITQEVLSAFALTLFGAPRTKKNHGRVIVRKRKGKNHRFHVPSVPYSVWALNARLDAPEQWGAAGCAPIDAPVNCCALFYRDRNSGDAVGYYQGLADLLQNRGVLLNDRLIAQWDGSRLLKDARNPRVEIVLTLIPEVTP